MIGIGGFRQGNVRLCAALSHPGLHGLTQQENQHVTKNGVRGSKAVPRKKREGGRACGGVKSDGRLKRDVKEL
eukprot:scaffold15548_cov31-Tisochrysis_lutea.AAC.2